jgi:hypothetical protein
MAVERCVSTLMYHELQHGAIHARQRFGMARTAEGSYSNLHAKQRSTDFEDPCCRQCSAALGGS